MITRRRLLAAALASVALAGRASAQAYPDRLIRIIVPFTAGGPVDVMARLVAQYLSVNFGQPVIGS